MSTNTLSSTANGLGYAGLIPFVTFTLALVAWPEKQLWWHSALLAYGAVILSFVGAIHWGLAMQARDSRERPAALAWSVVPSLLGWVALLVSAPWGYPVLLFGLWLHYAQDLRWPADSPLPEWYLPLRTRLTGVASICLLLAWVTETVLR